MFRTFGVAAVLLFLLCMACEKTDPMPHRPTPVASSGAAIGDAAAPSIGVATMEADGTIVLQLRAEGPGRTVGHALFRYPTTHAQYQSTLKHLGGLKPGEGKLVPPWP
jgi:hypothetical protein